MVGTRKGAFLLESDGDRRDWAAARPVLRGLAGLPRRLRRRLGHDLRRRGERVARLGGLAQPRPRRELGDVERGALLRRRRGPQGVEGVDARRSRAGGCSSASRRPGIFESRDGGETWSLLSTLVGPAGQRGVGRPVQPAAGPPRHLRRSSPTATTASSSWRSCRASAPSRRPTRATSWTPRNRGLRRDWPAEHEEVGFCVHKLVRSPSDGERMYQQNHVGMHRSDDEGRSWKEITEGLPSEFGFAAAAHPHDRDTFYVIPLDAGHGRIMPEGKAAVWRTSDGGSSWRPLRDGPAAGRTRTSACSAQGMAVDTPRRRLASTSARAPARCSRAPTRARPGSEIAELPARDLVGRRRGGRQLSAGLHLPTTLTPLFAGLPRRLDVEAATVAEAIDGLEEQWPGLRDRLVAEGPSLRPHIHVYVDKERAGLDGSARAALADGRDRRDLRRLMPGVRSFASHARLRGTTGSPQGSPPSGTRRPWKCGYGGSAVPPPPESRAHPRTSLGDLPGPAPSGRGLRPGPDARSASTQAGLTPRLTLQPSAAAADGTARRSRNAGAAA